MLHHGSHDYVAAKGGFVFYTGRSMLPTLREGDLLEVAIVERADIEAGDVVCVRSPEGRLVVHRVVASLGCGLSTRGDNCRNCDPWFTASVYVRRAIRLRRGSKWQPVLGGKWGSIYARLLQVLRVLLKPTVVSLQLISRGTASLVEVLLASVLRNFAFGRMFFLTRLRIIAVGRHSAHKEYLLFGSRILGVGRRGVWYFYFPVRFLGNEPNLATQLGLHHERYSAQRSKQH